MSFNESEEKISLLNEVTQYQRVASESDEENLNTKYQPATQDRRYKDKMIVWNCECISRLLVLYLLLMVAFGFALQKMPPIRNNEHEGDKIGMEHLEMSKQEHHHVFTKAAVSAGTEECSDVGVSILHEGGSAVDAAIATLLCQGVVQPQYSGIGGGFFMTVFNKTTKQSTVIDAREVAPRQASKDMLASNGDSATGSLSIAIPGEVMGYSYAYRSYGGKVSWERLFSTAIDKAENGFAVGGQLSANLQQSKDRILKSQSLCEIFCDETKLDVKKTNDMVKNLKLATTLKAISKNGPDAFYRGPTAQKMAEEIRKMGGIVTEKDLSDYEVIERPTLKIPLSSHMELHVPPLPSGGPALALIVLIMDKYNISSNMFKSNTNLYWHRTVESFKHAFGARTQFGDPAFSEGVGQLVSDYLSTENVLRLQRKILDDRTFHEASYYGAEFVPKPGPQTSTLHVSVLAPSGDAVAVTSTINMHFGSLHMSPTTGVLFNNEMDDFSFDGNRAENETGPNEIEPGKRPLSSMSPCVLVNKKTDDSVYILGAAGGKQITSSLALTLLRLLYFNVFDFDDAIRQPRLHHQLSPDTVFYEKEFDKEIIEALQQLGHKVSIQPPKSHVNGIKNHVSHIHAFSDLRSIDAEAAGW